MAEKRNRTERATLSQYCEGKNPYFCMENKNMFMRDPRIPENIARTKSYEDQCVIADLYKDEMIQGLRERFEEKPETFQMEYKPLNGSIMQAIVTLTENNKRISLVAPLSKVLLSNLGGDVCCTMEQEMKTVEIPPTDYATLVAKTEWKIICTESTYETAAHDGPQANEFNYGFLDFCENVRRFELAFIRDVARRMVAVIDEKTGKPKFLPELACNKEIKVAIKNGDVEAVAQEILHGMFLSVTRQARLEDFEQSELYQMYLNAHGQPPSEDYVAQNMSVAYSSGKVTFTTKQFQPAYGKNPKPVDMKGYSAHAKEVCEASPIGTRWCPPTILRASGNGTIPFLGFKISRGDVIAPYFSPSFMVYKTSGKVYCGFKFQLNQKILFYKKAPEYSSGGENLSAKKAKLSIDDETVAVTTAAAHTVREEEDCFGDEY